MSKHIATAAMSSHFPLALARLLAFAGWLREEHRAVEVADELVELCAPFFGTIRARAVAHRVDAVSELASAGRVFGARIPTVVPQTPPTKGQVRGGPLVAWQLTKGDKR